MTNTDDLRLALRELADTAEDHPEMLLHRSPGRRRRIGWPVLLITATTAALVVLTTLGLAGSRLWAPAPAAPTRAVPLPSTAASAPTEPSPSPSTSPSQGVTAPRPMTEREITSRTVDCMTGVAGLQEKRKVGSRLHVRYAMVQTAAGLPADGPAEHLLLLEDAGGYFDCSDSGNRAWAGKDGDRIPTDKSAAGWEIPSISGGSATQCGPPKSAATFTSAVVLKTAPRASAARITVHGKAGSRTATVRTSDGYVYLTALVTGKTVSQPVQLTVELMDEAGERLPIQPDFGSTTKRLRYTFEQC